MIHVILIFLSFICSIGCVTDIETYDVDTQLNKVIVTGNVTTEKVIKVLHKIGKQASNWDHQSSY